jgi:hypothetical protein
MGKPDRQILTEFITPTMHPLAAQHEDGKDGKNLWMTGVFIQGDVQNANGRIYPREEISNAVISLTKRIKEHGPVAGELDHPEGLMISGQNVSHAIHEMWMEGSNGMGKLLVIDEGKGKIVRSMVSAGINLGVSSRGSGSVDSKGRVSEFEIVTVDIVMTPSAPNAYPKAVFEALLNDKLGQELKYLSEIRNDRKAQKYFQKILTEYLINIRDEVTWRKR